MPPLRVTTKSINNAVNNGRSVLYPEVSVKKRFGESALTAKEAEKILGWQVVINQKDRSFRDVEGNTVVCTRNYNNRPLDMQWCKTLVRLILTKEWQLNLENIIIGRTGILIDGQHRLIALVLAVQEWKKNPERSKWTTEPTLDTLVAVGGDESDKTINSVNTGRSRTLTDVLSRSYHFQEEPEKLRVALAGICNYAIKFVWSRTGLGAEGYSVSKTTIAETIDFLDRHLKLRECAKFIYDLPRLPNFWTGIASGMLYLMACGSSDKELYYGKASPDEGTLVWDRWEKACEFWGCLHRGERRFSQLRKSLEPQMIDGVLTEINGKLRVEMVTKGWLSFQANSVKTLEDADFRPNYLQEEDTLTFTDNLKLGNIHLKGKEDANAE